MDFISTPCVFHVAPFATQLKCFASKKADKRTGSKNQMRVRVRKEVCNAENQSEVDGMPVSWCKLLNTVTILEIKP